MISEALPPSPASPPPPSSTLLFEQAERARQRNTNWVICFEAVIERLSIHRSGADDGHPSVAHDDEDVRFLLSLCLGREISPL
jgi:hypothetical protein